MKKLTTKEFISKAKRIHGNKYNYCKVNYINTHTKVCIICPKHYEFWQRPSDHLMKHGCPNCKSYQLGIRNSIKCTKNIKEILSKANKIHNNFYNYSLINKSNYKNTKQKIIIICTDHGSFTQRTKDHLQGHDCPKCRQSKGERQVEQYLKEHNIEYETQKRFPDCRNERPLPFDFWLFNQNTCIEYDGELHFKPYDRFGGKIRFEKCKTNDNLKTLFCQNNIKLIRINFKQFKQIDQILSKHLIK